MKELKQDFFERETTVVARELIGKILDVEGVRARIVETEAYTTDGASHAKVRTPRSSLMYDTHGALYVYLIYGMYHCLNITTHKGGVGAVLIRAAEPLSGLEKMQNRRGCSKERDLCSGPGKLCSALGITMSFNGLDVGEGMRVLDDGFVGVVGSGTRVGIRNDVDLPWRFFLVDSSHVSR